MPIEITMPRLSDTMEEGTLIRWRVKVGDEVKNGDLLADVETDKATMELQSYDDGTVAQIAIEEGQNAPVGKLILVLAQKGESAQDAVKAVGGGSAAGGASQGSAAASAGSSSAPSSGSGGGGGTAVATGPTTQGGAPAGAGRIIISPLARKIAEEHGVDPGTLRGSGPGGRIVKRDILAAAGGGGGGGATATRPPAITVTASPSVGAIGGIESKTIALSNMRKTIARRLVESKTTIPHFTVTVAVDMDPLTELRGTLNAQLENEGVKLSVNDFIVRATALALAQHPALNSSWTDNGIEQHGAINVGIAIALPAEKGGGLVVATIRDTQAKGLRAINAETRALAKKARGQGLSLEEMGDGTFTLSNLGMFDVEHFEAIINPPQAAILALGSAVEKPVVRNGRVAVGREMSATLSADHRIVDGAMAAQFLQTLRRLLENPAVLMV